MSRRAKVAGLVAAWLVVAGWAFVHGPFNGADLLVEGVLVVLIVALWRKAYPPRCPVCGRVLPHTPTNRGETL